MFSCVSPLVRGIINEMHYVVEAWLTYFLLGSHPIKLLLEMNGVDEHS